MSVQQVKPDYFIHVGIKDGKVVSTDWGDVTRQEKHVTTEELLTQVVQYLLAAKNNVLEAKRKVS